MDKKVKFKTAAGNDFEVPPGGSLGLLALGNIGVRAWKVAMKEWREKNEKKEGDVKK
jgi:hypothetical protein